MNIFHRSYTSLKRHPHILPIVVLLFALTGCIASMFLHGGEMMSDDYQIPKVLVEYTAEGPAPEGAQYLLIQNEDGVAMFERTLGGGGALFKYYHKDDSSEHFSAWIVTGLAYDFVIPLDRSKTAYRYVFGVDTYEVAKNPDGSKYVVSKELGIKPVNKLIPRMK